MRGSNTCWTHARTHTQTSGSIKRKGDTWGEHKARLSRGSVTREASLDIQLKALRKLRHTSWQTVRHCKAAMWRLLRGDYTWISRCQCSDAMWVRVRSCKNSFNQNKSNISRLLTLPLILIVGVKYSDPLIIYLQGVLPRIPTWLAVVNTKTVMSKSREVEEHLIIIATALNVSLQS